MPDGKAELAARAGEGFSDRFQSDLRRGQRAAEHVEQVQPVAGRPPDTGQGDGARPAPGRLYEVGGRPPVRRASEAAILARSEAKRAAACVGWHAFGAIG